MSAHFLAAMVKEPHRRWRLVDEASQVVIAQRVHAAFDSASRRTGMLGRDSWPDEEALVIAPCQAVHTVGMRYAIDVVLVRRDGTIEKVRSAVRPWRVAGAWRAFAVIEMAAGALQRRAPLVGPGGRLVVQPGD